MLQLELLIHVTHICLVSTHPTRVAEICFAQPSRVCKHFPQYTSFTDNTHSYHWNSINSYVFLTHWDLWQASQNFFLLFLLLSVHTPYHQGYVCVCKKAFITYSTVSTRMAGAWLHCIWYNCIELADAHNHMWDMSTASHICLHLTTIWIHHILLVSVATQWHHMMCVWLKWLSSIVHQCGTHRTNLAIWVT